MFVNISEDLTNLRKEREELIRRSGSQLKMMINHNHKKNSQKKMKRYRSAFTTDQVNYLEKQFKKCSYITNSDRKEVALMLNISERAVKIWFQNRRMKEKRENINKEFDEETEATSSEFANHQLNNVTTQSDNQQSQSVPLLTNIENVSDYKNISANHPKCNLNAEQSKNPETKSFEDFPSVKSKLLRHLQSPAIFSTSENSILANESTKPEEISLKVDRRLKSRVFDHFNITTPHSDPESKDNKKDTEDKIIANKKTLAEMIPEDLSGRNMPDRTSTANSIPSMTVSTPGYIPMLPAISPFYSDPYYNANGVLWRPLSVVPSVASNGTMSVHIPNTASNLPIIQQNVPKKCCKCECHEPLLSYNIQQTSPTPQYVITAVPLTNSSPQ